MLLELWEAALRVAVGIAVKTDNRKILQQHLYRARAEANDPRFEHLTITLPDNEDELWLVHKDADSDRTIDEGDIEPLYP